MSRDGRWVNVGEEGELPSIGMRLFFPEGLGTVLVRHDGEILAFSNRCPHMGCGLVRGTLEGNLVRCPCHDWTFDIRTGEFPLSPKIRVPVYRTKVEEGKIWIELED